MFEFNKDEPGRDANEDVTTQTPPMNWTLATKPTLSRDLFLNLSHLVYEQAGIRLGEKKEALLSARVGKRMRVLGLKTYEEYWRRLKNDKTGDEIIALLDHISTNVTYFYREEQHFDLLAERVRRLQASGQKRFRFWSAGCSTGEEPYSIAMAIYDVLKNTADVKILATDISTRVLKHANAGRYRASRIEKIPASCLSNYMMQNDTGGEATWEVIPEIRRWVHFARLNLSTVPYPMNGPFDVIFCRNVMIYFDNDVRRRLLAEMYRLLSPGGLLMVGHAESLSGMLSRFKSIKPSVYVKP